MWGTKNLKAVSHMLNPVTCRIIFKFCKNYDSNFTKGIAERRGKLPKNWVLFSRKYPSDCGLCVSKYHFFLIDFSVPDI